MFVDVAISCCFCLPVIRFLKIKKSNKGFLGRAWQKTEGPGNRSGGQAFRKLETQHLRCPVKSEGLGLPMSDLSGGAETL